MLEAWPELSAALATARDEIVAAAPDVGTATEGEAYLARVLAGSLTDTFLAQHLTQNGLTRAMPIRGAPNPDYIIYHAGLKPTQRYRLEGQMNGSERVGIGLYSFNAEGGALLESYASFDAGSASDGRFALTLASDAQGANQLAITPKTRVLIVRVLHRDASARTCALTLSGADAARALAAAGSGPDLVRAGRTTLSAVRQFLEWTRATGENPNQFIETPQHLAATVQGDPDTYYRLGAFNLKDGEFLEVLLPQGLAGYWSLHAYTFWCESLPGAGVHNISALPDADERMRARIGPSLPHAISNRVDTLGRRRGVLIFRAIQSEAVIAPQTAVLRTATRAGRMDASERPA